MGTGLTGAAMADLNQDLMTAKVPHWFTRLSGWEARLVALKADIALVFGVKPDTKDGDACMKVRVRGGGQAACRGRLRTDGSPRVRVCVDLAALSNGRCMVQAIEQVILDFLENITARPDRKINKVLCASACSLARDRMHVRVSSPCMRRLLCCAMRELEFTSPHVFLSR